MDIKAFCDPEKIEILLKNYDSPYDPLIIEEKGTEEDQFAKIGVVLAQKVADKILYSYAYHLNVITISMPQSKKASDGHSRENKMQTGSGLHFLFLPVSEDYLSGRYFLSRSVKSRFMGSAYRITRSASGSLRLSMKKASASPRHCFGLR